jgi:hypothetical protein
MPCYQLRLDRPLGDLLATVVARTTSLVPTVAPDLIREIVELVFRTRVVQSAACGRARECQRVVRPVFGEARRPPTSQPVRPCCLLDADVERLPAIFAVALADLAAPAADARAVLERRLGQEVKNLLAPFIFETEICGTGRPCKSARTDPFTSPDHR